MPIPLIILTLDRVNTTASSAKVRSGVGMTGEAGITGEMSTMTGASTTTEGNIPITDLEAGAQGRAVTIFPRTFFFLKPYLHLFQH